MTSLDDMPDGAHVVTIYEPGVGFDHQGRRHGALLGASSATCTCGAVERFPADTDCSQARQWARQHDRLSAADLTELLDGLQEAPPTSNAPRPSGLGAAALDAAQMVDDDHGLLSAGPTPGARPWPRWAAIGSGDSTERVAVLGAALTAAVAAGIGAALGEFAILIPAAALTVWLAASLAYLLVVPSEAP